MSSETIGNREGLIARLVTAIGHKRTPRDVNGHLVLKLPSGRRFEIGHPDHEPSAELQLRNWQPVWSSVRRGAVGFCESYMGGHWDSPDPAKLFHFYLVNRDSLDKASTSLFFQSMGDKLWHRLRPNSRKGAKRNIEAHYDLGNDFYALWLDPSMTYSSAWFGDGAEDLETAQHHKYRLVLDAADLQQGHRLLEIGCGWGGLAEAALARGARVTAITLSNEQFQAVSEKLGDRIDLRLQDYRDTQGLFDRIASIEMIEAVGEAHWPVYFRTLASRLKPGGVAAVQAITMQERYFAAYRKSADFIQRYIFPGGMVLTREIIEAQAKSAGLACETVNLFGRDYARTLRLWRDRFEAAWPQISAQGFSEQFRRKWRLYLAYCEAGFEEGSIDVGVYRLVKPA